MWTPCIPWYKSDKPGIAPDCGMKLEPVYADGQLAGHQVANIDPDTGEDVAPAPGSIAIDAQKQQLMGMRVGQAEWTTEGQTIRIAGRVIADETRVTRVHAKVGGWIEHVTADFTGALVRRPAAADAVQSGNAGQPAGAATSEEGRRFNAA